MTQFIGDDEAYFGWLEDHPHGFVVNCYRNPTTAYLVLHRAQCYHIQRWEGRTLTCGDYRKVCADTDQALHESGAGVGGELTRWR